MTAEFGEYRLARLMGEGGMAQVWSALRQTRGGPMRCAVKVIKPSHADDPSYREMFQREARLSLALSGHGNVVSVFDVGEHEGRSFLAMELVEGVTLAELARRVGKPWQVAQAVYVVAGVLRALCHIHGYAVEGVPQGIVHRDVTPHNVMISARGEVKLMDFGIAQRADAEPCLGGALGKLAYVPREQVEGDPDQRADLYAAGALLYELLDGRRFRWHCADEDAYFLEIYRDRGPTLGRKDIPPQVAAVLRGLLQPDRERRIATAAEALRQLEAWSGFRWALSELEAIYGAVIGAGPQDAAPGSDVVVSRGAARGRRPWDDSSPGAANDSGRSHRAPGTLEQDAAIPGRRRRTISVPVWADAEDPPNVAVTDELPAPDEMATRLLPAAEQISELSAEPMERLVTRRNPAALPEQDVPSARISAEIAVTMPQPSRLAPWAAGTDPIAGRLMQPEPGAPVRRRRAMDRTDSVAPRARESAAVHRAASGAAKHAPGVVAGEIVTDDGLAPPVDVPVWRVGSR
jgi:predicted Ser/Thr protein kinase